jgi:hypothetical protein
MIDEVISLAKQAGFNYWQSLFQRVASISLEHRRALAALVCRQQTKGAEAKGM